MSQNKKKLRYFSYLLRLWETDDGGQRVWHASLEYPASGQRRGFAVLEELFAYLQAETAVSTPPDVCVDDSITVLPIPDSLPVD